MDQTPNIHGFPLSPILGDASDGIAIAVPHPWRFVYINAMLARWLDIAVDQYGSVDLEALFRVAGSEGMVDALERIDDGGESSLSVLQELVQPDGATKLVEVRLRRIVVDETPLVSMVIHDLASTSRQDVVVTMVGRDPLTGLADRSVLFARMTALMRGDRAGDLRFAALFIDLDNFKQVNDAHGHLVGDRVLVEVAQRLSSCLRARDLIARFGGDEFVALVESASDMSEIQPVVKRIEAVLAKPITLDDGEVRLSVSVGVVQASPEHRTPEKLLAASDRAMYAAKRVPR